LLYAIKIRSWTMEEMKLAVDRSLMSSDRAERSMFPPYFPSV
jgi:hypothetical protein